ncbi:DUF4296 domain-containing protein [Salinimicrobium terrae]|uniref:DUF4296 domain-containing protein n=1 Tax=Salinimicrobium terrae TaxID=470866 RepID=UPI0003F8C107|nr:DUF4296 domain-containing protein [Salinimicrobium terrae]
MKKLWGVLAALIVLVSCQDINRTPKPDNLIPEEKMVEVLTELSLLHGARSYNMRLREEKGINAYSYLTEKFKIDSIQIVRSNEYYAQNYKQYKRIYEKVKERLELLMAEFDSIREIEEKKRDSLRNIKKDSIIPRDFKNDSLLPQPTGRERPLPVSRSRMQQ